MTANQQEIAQQIIDVSESIKQGLTDLVNARVAALLNDGNMSRIAAEVFDKKDQWGDKRSWIDSTIRECIRTHAYRLVREAVEEREDEIKQMVLNQLASMDVLEVITDGLVSKLKEIQE